MIKNSHANLFSTIILSVTFLCQNIQGTDKNRPEGARVKEKVSLFENLNKKQAKQPPSEEIVEEHIEETLPMPQRKKRNLAERHLFAKSIQQGAEKFHGKALIEAQIPEASDLSNKETKGVVDGLISLHGIMMLLKQAKKIKNNLNLNEIPLHTLESSSENINLPSLDIKRINGGYFSDQVYIVTIKDKNLLTDFDPQNPDKTPDTFVIKSVKWQKGFTGNARLRPTPVKELQDLMRVKQFMAKKRNELNFKDIKDFPDLCVAEDIVFYFGGTDANHKQYKSKNEQNNPTAYLSNEEDPTHPKATTVYQEDPTHPEVQSAYQEDSDHPKAQTVYQEDPKNHEATSSYQSDPESHDTSSYQSDPGPYETNSYQSKPEPYETNSYQSNLTNNEVISSLDNSRNSLKINKIKHKEKKYIAILSIASGTDMHEITKKFFENNPQEWLTIMKEVGKSLGTFHHQLASEEVKEKLAKGIANLDEFKTIVHGDLHFGNLFFDPQTQKMTLIDIASVADTIFDPLSVKRDIARLYAYTKYFEYGTSIENYPINAKNMNTLNQGFLKLAEGYSEAFPGQEDNMRKLVVAYLETLTEECQDSLMQIEINEYLNENFKKYRHPFPAMPNKWANNKRHYFENPVYYLQNKIKTIKNKNLGETRKSLRDNVMANLMGMKKREVI